MIQSSCFWDDKSVMRESQSKARPDEGMETVASPGPKTNNKQKSASSEELSA